MIIFLLSVSVLIALALFGLLYPLLRQHDAQSTPNTTSQELSARVLTEQLAQLDNDLASGALNTADYNQARLELQSRALTDLSGASATIQNAASSNRSKQLTIWLVALGIPLFSLGFYFWKGSPVLIDPIATQQAKANAQNEMIASMVARLAAKLTDNPNDLEGWVKLARSYKVLGKMQDAANAYEKAQALVNQHPDLLVDYAEVLANLDHNDLNQRALAPITKARQLDPKHPMALVLAGAAAYQRDDFKNAAKIWQLLLPLVDPNSADGKQVLANINQAQDKAKEHDQRAAATTK